MLKALPDTPERTQQELTLQVTLGRALMATKGYGAPEVAQGTTTHGLALVQQGRGEEGIAEIRQGMAAYQATGAELGRPNFLARLAEAYGKVGQAEGGLTVLAEALAVVHRNGERTYEAELYRLKGELLLRMGEREKGRMGEKEQSPHSPILPFFSRGVFSEGHRDCPRRQQAKL